MLGASDEEHLNRALAEGRVVVTQDEDFLRLHALGIEHAGVVYAPQSASIGDIIYGVMLVVGVLEPDDMKNHIEYI